MTAPATDRDLKLTRWVAAVAGIVGFLLSVATPLLPVVQTTAALNWPQHGELNSVTAPLISQTPVSMSVKVPCELVSELPAKGGTLLSTAPADGKDARLNGDR